jgi:crotonobetainyl-CoA:carnitine CoA-transferase CaiB-like acyl-CoA transferase
VSAPPLSDIRVLDLTRLLPGGFCSLLLADFGADVVKVEDNLYLPSGEMAKSNGELIAKARQMAEDVGRRAATVAEARELLGVPRRERSAA